ncbi:cytidylate kinase [Okibacterium sp. HSC-33S16]|uniref:(d)CMP kinase n=1 Tax=Okibacterium sp. HSC-33S16 TaxID=2910965 RepID=UPI00209EA535|nr:(d)CMP kinase [Okibacterium sp. HSC-33S16]MCP2032569.1 cytidylate kinase [Okibacterium sp. HSC-33S16]
MTNTVVAVDGPAGSGKSSVSKAAAKRLGFAFLDTGAAYRALAWHVLDSNADPEQATEVISSLAGFDYAIGTDPDGYAVHVAGTDVTDSIREPRVSAAVSAVARVPEVRNHLTALFRSIIRDSDKAGIIVEGRDITTVVAPDATARILLTASEEARMSRRSAELVTESASDVAIALQKRDRADSRVVDFMTAADGVVTVDSTHLNFDETVDAVLDVIRTSQET